MRWRFQLSNATGSPFVMFPSWREKLLRGMYKFAINSYTSADVSVLFLFAFHKTLKDSSV